MANKITELTAATTPLAGTELAWVEQGGLARKVAVSEFGGAGGAVNLGDLADVEIAGAPDAAFLILDTATGDWRDFAISGDVTINDSGVATVADDSHNHLIANVDGLQTALDGKLNTVSPTFTGTLSGPTVDVTTLLGDELRTGNGNFLVINVGESNVYNTGQTGELLYVNAEGGLEVNSSPDNWATGWAGRQTAFINNSSGQSSFPGQVTVGGALVVSGVAQGAGSTQLETLGVDMGSVIAGSATDLSRHLTLWGTSYGMNVTSSTLNIVSNGVNSISASNAAITSRINHDFSAGIDVTGNITVTGTVDGIDVAAFYNDMRSAGEFSATYRENIVQYNRFGAVQDMAGTTDWEPGVYGASGAMTNGPTGMSFDPFMVMGSSSDVRSFLVVPRTASRAIAYKGSSTAGATHTAWHYTGWTTTEADSDLSLYAKLASPTFSGDATFNEISVDLITQDNASPNRDKIRVWNSATYTIGMNDAMSFGGLNDFAMTFQFNNDTDRGFWWGHDAHTDAQGAMSLTTDGNLTVAQRIRVGFGESDTTAPSGLYDIITNAGLNVGGASVFADSLIATNAASLGYYAYDNVPVTLGLSGDSEIVYENASDELRIKGLLSTCAVRIMVNSTETAFVAEPNSWVELYHNNQARLRTGAAGMIYGTSTTSLAHSFHSNASFTNEIGRLSWGAGGGFNLDSYTTGANAGVRVEDSGGTLRNAYLHTGTQGTIYHAGLGIARTLVAGNGGLEVNNTVTGAGYERVLTTSDTKRVFRKTANETVASSTTLQNDNHIASITLEAGEWYRVEMSLDPSSGSGTPGLRFGFLFSNAPADIQDGTVEWGSWLSSSTSINRIIGAFTTTFTGISVANTANNFVRFKGSFRANATTGGTMTLQWAQNVSNASGTTLTSGDWLTIEKI